MMEIRDKTIAFASNKKRKGNNRKAIRRRKKYVDTLLSQMTADTSLEQNAL